MNTQLHALRQGLLMALLIPMALVLSSGKGTTPTCTAPPAPIGIISTANSPYSAGAVYFGGQAPASVDGYEWTISGNAYIQSGQGSSNINYYYSCGDIEICVRAYSLGAFGTKCYSSEVCRTYNHLGEPCM